MTYRQLIKFIKNLSKDYLIYAPVKKGEELYIQKIETSEEIDFLGKIPFNTFKKVFLPQEEVLFKEEKVPARHQLAPQALADGKPTLSKLKKIVAWGMNILDLKALVLLDQVFEKDPYYQARRRNILVVGFSTGIPSDYRKYKVFSLEFEENVLEHLIFDFFVLRQKNNNFKIFSGSRKGQQVLEKYRIKEYEHIEFAGLIPEEGPDKKMLVLKEKIEKSQRKKIWQELDKRCLACGKCTIYCPTCFCFDLEDGCNFQYNSRAVRKRIWTSCFYPDFSRITSRDPEGFRFLDTIKKKIYFWYYHKFVRLPAEFSLPGCVSCNRCTRVCPVGIDISKVLSKL